MPRGTTLIELLVVLVILAIAASVGGLAFGTGARRANEDAWRAALEAARREAIASGIPVVVRLRTKGDSLDERSLTALPDGSVIAPPDLMVNRWTGRAPRSAEP